LNLALQINLTYYMLHKQGSALKKMIRIIDSFYFKKTNFKKEKNAKK